MRRMRSRYFVLPLILLLGAVASCSTDSPSAPAAPVAKPNASLLGDLLGATGTVSGDLGSVSGLLACPHDERYVGSATIGPDGGTIRVGPHRLDIPSGALKERVQITADAPAGNTVRVDFHPEGLKFQRAAILTLSYRDCGAVKLLPRIVYVDDDLKIAEILLSLANPWAQTVTARIEHFSWYALAD